MPGFVEELFLLKLMVLKYLAKTGQGLTSSSSNQLFSNWKGLKPSKQKVFVLMAILDFLVVLSPNSEFASAMTLELVHQLLGLFSATPNNDLLHCKITQIFVNCAGKLNSAREIQNVLVDFLSKNLLDSNPQDKNDPLRKVSKAHFVEILKVLEVPTSAPRLQEFKEESLKQTEDPESLQDQSSMVISEVREINREGLENVMLFEKMPSEQMIKDHEDSLLMKSHNKLVFLLSEANLAETEADPSNLEVSQTINAQHLKERLDLSGAMYDATFDEDADR